MTQQDFARMTAVIDKWLREAAVSATAFKKTGLPAAFGFYSAKQDAAADLLEALPVPEDE